MALRTIRISGDPVLTRKCREVKEMTPRLAELIDDMFETMYEENGVGLAAPQVGILKRICVIDTTGETPLVLINPVITEKDGEQTGDEGCLSLPGKAAPVTRPMVSGRQVTPMLTPPASNWWKPAMPAASIHSRSFRMPSRETSPSIQCHQT